MKDLDLLTGHIVKKPRFTYRSYCGKTSVHLQVVLWRDLGSLASYIEKIDLGSLTGHIKERYLDSLTGHNEERDLGSLTGHNEERLKFTNRT